MRDKERPGAELTRDAIFLQPWFVPIEVYRAIRRLLPYVHLFKMRYYFEDYGCLKCGKREVMYQSNGFCETCGVVVRHRVEMALKRRLKKAGVDPEGTDKRATPDGMLAAQAIFNARRRRL